MYSGKNINQVSGNLYIGPAGWSYQDWLGTVYPRGSGFDRLAMISRYFNCVELNSSFYHIPSRKLVQSWVSRLSGNRDFQFSIKVSREVTHKREYNPSYLNKFIHRFDTLINNGLMGAFLLQFPWSFKNTVKNRDYLRNLSDAFAGYPTAVELRNGSWNNREALSFLRDCKLGICNIDQPQIGYSMPPMDVTTSGNLGYIRLHGRNRANWFSEDAGRDERYNYLYSPDELDKWRERAERMLNRTKNLFLITNNHFRGQAVVNGLQLKSMMEQKNVEIPPDLLNSYPLLQSISRGTAVQGSLLDEECD